jgi:ankyrin repeat protein
VSDDYIAPALTAACHFNQLSTAQLLIKRGHISTQNLTEALSDACLYGHMRIVIWLISDVMTLSHTDRITWLLTAACARGDMRDIQQLATQVDRDVTRVMSQALRFACNNGREDVVKWLTSHTTADVSSLGVIYKPYGEMTSLMVACE